MKIKQLTLLVLIIVSSVFGTYHTWTGAGGDNNWENPANWHPEGVPSTCSYVYIPEGATVVYSGTSTLNISMLVNAGTIRLTGSMTAIDATGNVHNLGTIESTGWAKIYSKGTITNEGNINLQNGLVNGGNIVNASGGSITASGEESEGAGLDICTPGSFNNRGNIGFDGTSDRGDKAIVVTCAHFDNSGTIQGQNTTDAGGGRVEIKVSDNAGGRNTGTIAAGSSSSGSHTSGFIMIPGNIVNTGTVSVGNGGRIIIDNDFSGANSITGTYNNEESTLDDRNNETTIKGQAVKLKAQLNSRASTAILELHEIHGYPGLISMVVESLTIDLGENTITADTLIIQSKYLNILDLMNSDQIYAYEHIAIYIHEDGFLDISDVTQSDVITTDGTIDIYANEIIEATDGLTMDDIFSPSPIVHESEAPTPEFMANFPNLLVEPYSDDDAIIKISNFGIESFDVDIQIASYLGWVEDIERTISLDAFAAETFNLDLEIPPRTEFGITDTIVSIISNDWQSDTIITTLFNNYSPTLNLYSTIEKVFDRKIIFNCPFDTLIFYVQSPYPYERPFMVFIDSARYSIDSENFFSVGDTYYVVPDIELGDSVFLVISGIEDSLGNYVLYSQYYDLIFDDEPPVVISGILDTLFTLSPQLRFDIHDERTSIYRSRSTVTITYSDTSIGLDFNYIDIFEDSLGFLIDCAALDIKLPDSTEIELAFHIAEAIEWCDSSIVDTSFSFTVIDTVTQIDTITYALGTGWNMLAAPFEIDIDDAFPFLIPPAWDYNPSDGYTELDIASDCNGFWLLTDIDTTINLEGTIPATSTIHLHRGFNLIGIVDSPIPSSTILAHDEIVPSIYSYDPETKSYFDVDMLWPGVGYWVLSTEEFDLIIDD